MDTADEEKNSTEIKMFQVPTLDERQIKLTPEHIYIVGIALASSYGLGLASLLIELLLKRTTRKTIALAL